MTKEFEKPTDFDPQEVRNTNLLMPLREEIPEEFWRDSNPWNDYMARLFFCGGKKADAKDGINKKAAWQQLAFILTSWDTEHNHKIAACAYLGSVWLTEPAETNEPK